jgi:ATP phosphoribosyltransferase
MLRIAVPNKGILSEATIAMLKEAGYATRRDPKDLHVVDTLNDVEFFYLRPRDIATYVGEGALDAGFTGLDLLLDSRSDAEKVANLNFGGSTFRFAGPAGAFTSLQQLQGLRVATAYPNLVEDFLKLHGVRVHLVALDGAVEVAVRLGVADAVADVVSTGNTLRLPGGTKMSRYCGSAAMPSTGPFLPQNSPTMTRTAVPSSSTISGISFDFTS